MSIATHRGSRVKVAAEQWPDWTDQGRWSLTVDGHLVGIPVGHTEEVNGRIVARLGPDEYEVVSYGRRVLDRATASILVSD